MRTTVRYAALAFYVATPPAVAATHFGVKPILIAGSALVSASAINNHGAITGYTMKDGSVQAFIQSAGTLTILPPAYSGCDYPCPARPVAINAAGDVVGAYYYGQEYSFLWHDGAYVTAGSVILGLGGLNLVGINNRGGEFYDYYRGSGIYEAYAGKPGAFVPVTPPGSFPVIRSINNDGTVAGDYSPVDRAVFTDKAGVYATLIPPGAFSAFGGFINDHGQVAGIYQDSQGKNHGFVYKAGTYTRFNIPGFPNYVMIHGINNKGRVVGIYIDTVHNEQRAFLFNGVKLTAFGHYGAMDDVHVAINDEGVMIISHYLSVQGVPDSFRVLCGGDGC